jgi:hypothetical protein
MSTYGDREGKGGRDNQRFLLMIWLPGANKEFKAPHPLNNKKIYILE